MATATLDIGQQAIFAAICAFVLSALGSGVECVQAQDNRVPEPTGPNYIVMTPILALRLKTNETSYDALNDEQDTLQAQRYDVQLDIYGPASGDNATILTTLFRDEYGTTNFPANIQPLYADDARQAPMVNGEKQYETRWIITASLQYNPTVTTGAEFFDAIEVTPVNVDVTYPPT